MPALLCLGREAEGVGVAPLDQLYPQEKLALKDLQRQTMVY